MALRLDNFEQVVEPVIVQRGRTYFRSGKVKKCVEENGEVEAIVVGSGLYKVEMEVDDDGSIHHHSCTCPYDWGEVCKHEVAVLYYLREQRKKAARKAEVADIVENMKAKINRSSAIESQKQNKETTSTPVLYDPHLKDRQAENKLSDELFVDLPKDDFDKRILSLYLLHKGIIYSGSLSRVAKNFQQTTDQVQKRMKALLKDGFLTKPSFREVYPVADYVTLPLVMYIFDRHPEWLAAELADIGQFTGNELIFWNVCAALYDEEYEFLKRQKKSFDWSKQGVNVISDVVFTPFYEPLFYTVDDSSLRKILYEAMHFLELGDMLQEVALQRVQQLIEQYGTSKATSADDIFYEDYFAFLRYISGGALPKVSRKSSEWAYIAHAISAMHHSEWDKAGQLFEKACKIRNKKAKDKNLFYDPIANYYLMVYYAKEGSEASKTKVHQYLRKAVSQDAMQLPAYIVANYMALGEDSKNCTQYIRKLLKSDYPLMHSFARLFADYFSVDVGDVKPTNIALLKDEPLLFSIHLQSPWEKALDGLLKSIQGDQPQPIAPAKNLERLVYVIWPSNGESHSIWPQKQKSCTDGRWSKPYNVSAQTYFTVGYDFMDDIDRQIFERLRKTVGHTKYYYRPNWGTLEDYLPFLVDTDKVYYRKSDYDYEPVTVRKERAYLMIEHKGKNLVFASNIKMNKKDFALVSPCVVEESPTSYVVVELSEYEKKVFGTLLRLGPIPAEAEERLKQLISAMGNQIEIHSELIEGGSTLEKLPGDTTIVLRIAPKKGEFTLECCVQPLQGGKLRFYPGQGKATIFDEKEGTRYQVERDLEVEREHLLTLYDFCSEQLHILLNAEPQMIGIEDVLTLMEFVRDSAVYAIEWQDGAKLSVKEPVQEDSYSMGLRTRENWFEVEGELQLDEKTILSAAELLKLMQGNMVGKRFVRLNESEFIALNERLAKQLNRVQQIAQINRNHVLIPRFEIGLLGELLSHPDTILQQDEGVRELLHKIDRAATMEIPVPTNLHATLRDYQEEGFKWMMRLSEWGAGACLADDMGLGKTVQTISVLLAKADKGPSLVVAPASVVYNWQSELQRFAPTLKVHILNEADNRKKLIKSLQANDVLLTTYGLLVREEKTLTEKPWNVVCLDEAHTIKNRATKMSQAAMCLRAEMRIALTGTPLQNYLSELWNLSQFINPGLLGSFETFSHDFITPIEAEHNKERQKLLRKILQPFLLRRTKAEVIDELPDKTEITRRIELTPEERVAYEAMRIEAQQQVAQASKVDMNVLASITRLRQAACSLELVQNGASLSSDGGSKLADFAELISQIVTGGNRVLVFSQFTSFLQMAMNAVIKEPMANGQQPTAFYLNGSTPLNKRKQMVEAFQRGEAQVFFISLKAGGLGLNLTEANYVIHLDPWWNPAIEQQATDRAYRIGQKRNVTVYHLIAADTIEEKILRLHKTKRDLADALLQDQNTTHALTLADLNELLSATQF